MDGKTLALLYQTVQNDNILPVTTVCNVRCAFCSHHQNPPEVKAIAIPHLDPELVDDLLDYLDGSRKIIIGESTSLIMEGEPFTHPRFFEILEAIRRKFPQTLIQITTNGTMLTETSIVRLKALEPLELVVSLNACHPGARRQLMADGRADVACTAPPLLQKHRLRYHGSIVAMPHLTGWQELDDTVHYLARNGARTIRLFQPGYTRLTRAELIPPEDTFARLRESTRRWQQEGIVITLEPSPASQLDAVVEGVIDPSPAREAGLKQGDVLTAIDGARPFSRVDAFHRLQENGRHHITWQRDGAMLQGEITVTGQFSGVVMYYDLPPERMEALRRLAADGRSYLMLCSVFAHPVWQAAAVPDNVTLLPVKSCFFGGNIGAAGLLTIGDFAQALAQYPGGYDAIILPSVAFQDGDRDLAGCSLFDWRQELGYDLMLL